MQSENDQDVLFLFFETIITNCGNNEHSRTVSHINKNEDNIFLHLKIPESQALILLIKNKSNIILME